MKNQMPMGRCPLTYLPSTLTEILLPRLNQLLLGKFLIVGFVLDAKIWRGCSSPCKLSENLLLVSIGFNMSEQHLVEHEGVCFLMFL